jgi:hypothetical protein
MKNVFIVALAAVGAYAIYQWYGSSARSPRGQGAHNNGPWPVNRNTGAPAGNGVGDFLVSNVASGVPGYDQTPVEAGHGDMQAAAKHSNPFSTINGSSNYTPAFGPNENQNPATQVTVVV